VIGKTCVTIYKPRSSVVFQPEPSALEPYTLHRSLDEHFLCIVKLIESELEGRRAAVYAKNPPLHGFPFFMAMENRIDRSNPATDSAKAAEASLIL
jgi:hypothetical protein